MFRLWAREIKDNHTLKELVVEDASDLTRTKKVFKAIDRICEEFDLSHPVWLEKNTMNFKRHSKTRFSKDNFMEGIEFDFLEIQMIEED